MSAADALFAVYIYNVKQGCYLRSLKTQLYFHRCNGVNLTNEVARTAGMIEKLERIWKVVFCVTCGETQSRPLFSYVMLNESNTEFTVCKDGMTPDEKALLDSYLELVDWELADEC